MQLLQHRNTLLRAVLAASLAIMLTACGGSSTGVVSTPATTSSSASSETSSSASSQSSTGGNTATGSATGTTSSSTNSGSQSSTGGNTATGSATGTLSLQWTAPVSRTDGTPLSLSEIAGYRVHYGSSPGSYSNHIDITNGSLQSAKLTGVPVGTYYVAMSTYDASGLESAYSPHVIKKVL